MLFGFPQFIHKMEQFEVILQEAPTGKNLEKPE